MSRSIIIYESAIRSEFTRKAYRSALDLFLRFSKLKEYDALLTQKDEALNKCWRTKTT